MPTTHIRRLFGTSGHFGVPATTLNNIEWLKKSGLVLNSSKTESCYFAKRELEHPPKIEIDGVTIETKMRMKVLGLTFDHKMSWEAHVEKLLKEASINLGLFVP